jgi:hypothetical protein
MMVVTLVGLALLGATQALSASAGTAPATPAHQPFAGYVTPSGPELSTETIEGIARENAKDAGEPNPSAMSVGKGSLEEAMRTVDPSTVIPESPSAGYRAMLATPVDLVVMHGQFTLSDASVPRGDRAPTGSVLDLTIDSHSGVVIGRALPASQPEGGIPLATIASRKVATGVITGHLYLSGGPHFLQRRYPGRHAAGNAGVVVTNDSHKVLARTTTTEGGAFSIRIRPGSYLVAGTASASCTAEKVVIRAKKKIHTTIFCAIK